MSLRDQMLKAGLITEEQAKRSAHTERVDRKRSDPKERAQRQQAARDEVKQAQEAERTRHRQQSRAQQQEQSAKERDQAQQQRQLSGLEAAYREGAIPSWEGARRYYYAAEGRVDWLMVSEEAGRRLESGQAAICAGERNRQRPVVLTASAAHHLQELAPDRVLVWHRA
jgi:uncharacterized protein